MTETFSPPRLRVRLSFLAPALVNRFDRDGRLRTGTVVGLDAQSWPLVLWDDDPFAPDPIRPEWLEIEGDDQELL